MNKPTLQGYIKDNAETIEARQSIGTGPFVTISRQFGCCGYEIADMLAKKLNEIAGAELWKVYHKEILATLAQQSGFSIDTIEKAATEKAGFLHELLRNIRMNAVPDTFEIRSQIAIIVRELCFKGHAIIVGQGGSAATADMENGLSIRVEAPLEWRIPRICRRENIDRDQAIERINEVEHTRLFLRQTYVKTNQWEPAFNLSMDNSVFTAEQLVAQMLLAMSYRGMLAGVNIIPYIF